MMTKEDEINKKAFCIVRKMLIVLTVCLFISCYVHEIGHVIGYALQGIPAEIVFIMNTPVGPAIMTQTASQPPYFGKIFVIALGPGFAAIVFAILGRWCPECNVVAIAQAFYMPFEVLTWVLGFQLAENVVAFVILALLLIPVPVAMMCYKVLGRKIVPRVLQNKEVMR